MKKLRVFLVLIAVACFGVALYIQINYQLQERELRQENENVMGGLQDLHKSGQANAARPTGDSGATAVGSLPYAGIQPDGTNAGDAPADGDAPSADAAQTPTDEGRQSADAGSQPDVQAPSQTGTAGNNDTVLPYAGLQPSGAGTGDQPAVSAGDPPADAVQQPADGAQRPVTAARQPAYQSPSQAGADANADAVLPYASLQSGGASVGNQPANTGNQPADSAQQPANAAQQPANTGNQPIDAAQQPADAAQQPANAGNQLADAAQRPVTAAQPIENGQPAANGQPITGGQPIENGQPAADGAEPQTDGLDAEEQSVVDQLNALASIRQQSLPAGDASAAQPGATYAGPEAQPGPTPPPQALITPTPLPPLEGEDWEAMAMIIDDPVPLHTPTPIPEGMSTATPTPTPTLEPTPTPDRTIRTGALAYEYLEKVTLDESKILPELREIYDINQDLVGWITVDNTIIDYPVVQCADSNYYLHHDFYHRDNANGLIILDTRCDPYTPSYNLVISGHHMRSGQMFGYLPEYYSTEKSWAKRRVIQFDTLMARKRYIIFAAFRSADYDEYEEGFRYNADIQYKIEADRWLEEIRENQLYDTGIDVQFGDEFITLTTCDRSRRQDGRFVVVARRIREGEVFENE